MSKGLPIKYKSEEAVKKALKIDTFRNLSKDKIMQFASMIPYMDKEVAIAIINQFPVFADFGKSALSCYMQLCDSILERNRETTLAAVQGYQTILEALLKRMDADNLQEKERKAITKDMIEVADKIAEVDFQNKKFLERLGKTICWSIIGIAVAIGIPLGISYAIGGDGDLPELPDDDLPLDL